MFFMHEGIRRNYQIQKDFKSMPPHTTIEKKYPGIGYIVRDE